jgi:hypothetical protein
MRQKGTEMKRKAMMIRKEETKVQKERIKL